MRGFVSIYISLVKQLLLTALAVGFFAQFGPEIIALPGSPHARIKDVRPELITKPAAPLAGAYAPNEALKHANVLWNNSVLGSESVLTMPDESLLLLDKYGYAHRANPDATAPGGFTLQPTPLAHLGPGRPLGFKRLSDGSLIICNAGLGLIRLEFPKGAPPRVVLVGSRVTPDSPVQPNTNILYANALDVTADGSVVYFTDSQAIPVTPNFRQKNYWWDTLESFLFGVYVGQASGRLLAYYPNNGSIHVLATGFWYSNGVALSPDESFVAVAETNMFRVLRFWLKGEMAGQLEILVDNLPGFPDGVSTALGGKGFWVALPAPHTQLFDLALKVRLIRVILAHMPPSLRPPLPAWGAVALVSPEGNVTKFLLDKEGSHVHSISDVHEDELADGRSRLWMGSVKGHFVAYLDL